MGNAHEYEIYVGNDHLIFLGLKKLIETCDGTAFHNSDLGSSVHFVMSLYKNGNQ